MLTRSGGKARRRRGPSRPTASASPFGIFAKARAALSSSTIIARSATARTSCSRKKRCSRSEACACSSARCGFETIHAASYKRRDGLRDGVMTVSRVASIGASMRIICKYPEPVLRTPKAALFKFYQIEGSPRSAPRDQRACNLDPQRPESHRGDGAPRLASSCAHRVRSSWQATSTPSHRATWPRSPASSTSSASTTYRSRTILDPAPPRSTKSSAAASRSSARVSIRRSRTPTTFRSCST